MMFIKENNFAYASITITQPPPTDIVVEEVFIPSVANVGESLTIDWILQNISPNPAVGKMREAIYLSKDEAWDIEDALIGLLDCDINLPPQAIENRTLTFDLTGLAIGEYYAIVRTDIVNNIYESFDNNNSRTSFNSVNVNVKELALNTLTNDVLYDQTGLYYRLEIPDSLNEESLLLTFLGDSINGVNEMYLRYNDVPTRANFDYNYQTADFGNQQIVVPDLSAGVYYILVYGITTAGDLQNISLLAEKLNFEILNVNANEGGNTGFVTIQLNGAKFDSITNMQLIGEHRTLEATKVHYIDPTKIYATFDLRGVYTGTYNVLANKPNGEIAVLENGFNIVAGKKASIATNLISPSALRIGETWFLKLEYSNNGNVDIYEEDVVLQSITGAPAALTVEGLKENLTELNLPLIEFEGPPGVLRPGATGTTIIYIKANKPLGFLLQLPDLDD